jgi:hypothetical protein
MMTMPKKLNLQIENTPKQAQIFRIELSADLIDPKDYMAFTHTCANNKNSN